MFYASARPTVGFRATSWRRHSGWPNPRLHPAPRGEARIPSARCAEPGTAPNALLEAYNASPLAAAGITGKGTTIVFFAFSGYDQKDLDTFADLSGLPRFTPELVGGQPGPVGAETAMDLEVAHAIAPDAQKVIVNARPTVEGDGAYEKIGQLFESVDRQFPGAVWSLSIGWGCDALISAADLAPVEAALATAHETRHVGVRRERRHGRSGMQGRRRVVGATRPR